MRTVKCGACGLTFPEDDQMLHVREHMELENLARRAGTPIKTDFPLPFSYVSALREKL